MTNRTSDSCKLNGWMLVDLNEPPSIKDSVIKELVKVVGPVDEQVSQANLVARGNKECSHPILIAGVLDPSW